MGGGAHGGFGSTQGSKGFRRFTRVDYVGTVTVKGQVRDVSRRVYQRDDIDFDYHDAKGRSNLERMEKGWAPIGNDGRPVQLHHILQTETGPMVEIRETTHREYKRTLHGLAGKGQSFRNDPTLDVQYRKFKRAYWKWRAQQHKKGSSK